MFAILLSATIGGTVNIRAQTVEWQTSRGIIDLNQQGGSPSRGFDHMPAPPPRDGTVGKYVLLWSKGYYDAQHRQRLAEIRLLSLIDSGARENKSERRVTLEAVKVLLVARREVREKIVSLTHLRSHQQLFAESDIKAAYKQIDSISADYKKDADMESSKIELLIYRAVQLVAG